MYSLTYDTTAAQCALLLQKDGKSISRYSEYMDFGQAEVLIPQMKNMLEEAKLNFKDIDLLTVCTGPGSFTGVRAGIAAARAFSIANEDLKVCGVSAFEAYVLSFSADELAELNAVIIETKRDDFYVQLFDQKLTAQIQPTAATYDDIKTILTHKHKKVSLIGDGVERFLSRPSGLRLHSVKMPSALSVDFLAEAGLTRLKDKHLDFPKPLYLRAPDVSLPKNR